MGDKCAKCGFLSIKSLSLTDDGKGPMFCRECKKEIRKDKKIDFRTIETYNQTKKHGGTNE